MTARLGRLLSILALAAAPAIVAEEVRLTVDLGKASPHDWSIVADGYSSPHEPPIAKQVVLEDGSAYLGFFLPFPPQPDAACYILVPENEWKDRSLRWLKQVKLQVYGIRLPYRAAVILEDGNGKRHEYYFGALDFEGPRELTYTANRPLEGFTLEGIVVYPVQLDPMDGMRVAVYLKNLEIRGDTSLPPTEARP